MEKEQMSHDIEHADVVLKDEQGPDEYIPDTEEERKLVRKIDLYILPMMWIMYLLSYMDRTKSVIPTGYTSATLSPVLTEGQTVSAMPKSPVWTGTSISIRTNTLLCW